MRHTAGGVAGVAGAAALVLCAAAVWRGAGAGPGARAARVALQATEVGSVGPGSMLTLQTASGPMQLTVDSQMNQGHPCAHAPIPPCLRVCALRPLTTGRRSGRAAGYVHAYGYENGQMYAGYVQLTARNAAAQQALAQAPTAAQAQLAQYPTANPYTRQAAYSAAAQQWQGQSGQTVMEGGAGAPTGGLQLHVGEHGGVTLNGQRVVASDSKTAAILRLLAKRVQAQRAGLAGGPVQQLSGGWTGPAHSSKLDREISRAKRLVSKLESVRAERGDARQSMLVAHRSVRRRHDRGRGEPRAAIWAAMQSLMHSVDNIEKKQNAMDKVVKKVCICAFLCAFLCAESCVLCLVCARSLPAPPSRGSCSYRKPGCLDVEHLCVCACVHADVHSSKSL